MSKTKTLPEWIELYNRKTPEPFKRDERFRLFFLPDKGFCEIGNTEKMIVINQLSGDGRFWKKFAEELARENRFKMCGTWCVRKQIKAWIRLFGFTVTETENFPDGLKRFKGIDENGRKGRMSPAYDGKTGEFKNYYVTWEV